VMKGAAQAVINRLGLGQIGAEMTAIGAVDTNLAVRFTPNNDPAIEKVSPDDAIRRNSIRKRDGIPAAMKEFRIDGRVVNLKTMSGFNIHGSYLLARPR
jgi:hypothetical protein